MRFSDHQEGSTDDPTPSPLFSSSAVTDRRGFLRSALQTLAAVATVVTSGSMSRRDEEQIAHVEALRTLASKHPTVFPFDDEAITDINLLETPKPIGIGRTTFRFGHGGEFSKTQERVVFVGERQFMVHDGSGTVQNPLSLIRSIRRKGDIVVFEVPVVWGTKSFAVSTADFHAMITALHAAQQEQLEHTIAVADVDTPDKRQSITLQFVNAMNTGGVR